MANENNQISGQYLDLFFKDIESLNDYSATFKNVLVEVKTKANAEDTTKTASKMDTDEKKRLWFQAQTVRYLITRIHIKLIALSNKVPDFKNLDLIKIGKLRDEIREAPIPDFSKVEEYAQEVNNCFVTGIAAQFLEGSGAGYSSLIGNQNFEGDGKQ